MSEDSVANSEIQRFESQYRQNPDSLVFARLADAYRRAGEPERALEILESRIGRHGNYPTAHIVRAKTFVDLGQTGSAEEAFLRVLELDSGNLVALRGLATLARERGDLAGARQWFQRISGLNPGPPDFADENPIVVPALAKDAQVPTGTEPLPRTEEEWWTPDSEAIAPNTEPDAAESEASSPSESWWFEDPGEGDSAEDGDLLTRTMAQLYEKQGLFGEAAAIYRELLRDRPDDGDLLTVLAGLETRLVAMVPEVSSPDESLADLPLLDERVARHTAPAAEPAPVVEPAAAEPMVHTSGQGTVFRTWLRKLGE
ncbi:MAG: tetratricopeptide repeat protein [Gemmatimonadales bacterium]|nr:MAG: tetratricopeptide repeat protein [Gemmatimonadales bacterium]